MTTENTAVGQSKGDKIVAGINEASEVIGTLVPTVAAIGALARLIATAIRPSDAQKAQVFDDAIAKVDASLDKLDTAIGGFEAAKAQAATAALGGSSAAGGHSEG